MAAAHVTKEALIFAGGGAAVALIGAAACTKLSCGRSKSSTVDTGALNEAGYELWSAAELAQWLQAAGAVTQAEGRKLVSERVDGACIALLNDAALAGCGISSVGSRLRIQAALRRLKDARRDSSPPQSARSPSTRTSRGVSGPEPSAPPRSSVPGSPGGGRSPARQGGRGPAPEGEAATRLAAEHIRRLDGLAKLLTSDRFISLPAVERKKQLERIVDMLTKSMREIEELPKEQATHALPLLHRIHDLVVQHDKACMTEVRQQMEAEVRHKEAELRRLEQERGNLMARREVLLREQREVARQKEELSASEEEDTDDDDAQNNDELPDGDSMSIGVPELARLRDMVAKADGEQLKAIVQLVSKVMQNPPRDAAAVEMIGEIVQAVGDRKDRQEAEYARAVASIADERLSAGGSAAGSVVNRISTARDLLDSPQWDGLPLGRKMAALETGFEVIEGLSNADAAANQTSAVALATSLKRRQQELISLASQL
eukprot:TRINITY_DN7749_c0_g1_i2.p1 TRINITY_DN7749_c0_g1~~TRINITY_DN7749_c0_g1_i2.p1  ORF type:complete len:489 (+),score=175.52 TRINITY_DN7749_c0_g1_i2:86-1552(+)